MILFRKIISFLLVFGLSCSSIQPAFSQNNLSAEPGPGRPVEFVALDSIDSHIDLLSSGLAVDQALSSLVKRPEDKSARIVLGLLADQNLIKNSRSELVDALGEDRVLRLESAASLVARAETFDPETVRILQHVRKEILPMYDKGISAVFTAGNALFDGEKSRGASGRSANAALPMISTLEDRIVSKPNYEFIGLAFSPDGKRLLTVNDRHHLEIWDAETLHRLKYITPSEYNSFRGNKEKSFHTTIEGTPLSIRSKWVKVHNGFNLSYKMQIRWGKQTIYLRRRDKRSTTSPDGRFTARIIGKDWGNQLVVQDLKAPASLISQAGNQLAERAQLSGSIEDLPLPVSREKFKIRWEALLKGGYGAALLALVVYGAASLWALWHPNFAAFIHSGGVSSFSMAGLLYWDKNLKTEINTLTDLSQLGFNDPVLSKVAEAAGSFYEEARKRAPKGRLGGRKEAFTQRDLTRAWALSFRRHYLRLKTLTVPELAAVIAFQQALEFSYGAALDYDPADTADAKGDRKDFEPILYAAVRSLASDLGLDTRPAPAAIPTAPLTAPTPAPAPVQNPVVLIQSAAAYLDGLSQRKTGLSLEQLLAKAEDVAVASHVPHSSPLPAGLESSGAVLRSSDAMEKQFVTEVWTRDSQGQNQHRKIDSAWRILDSLREAVELNMVPALIGPTGTGKSASVKWLAAANDVPHLTVAMKPTIGKEDMIGSVRPIPIGLAWQWGFLIKAMVNGDWVTLEEMNLAPSEVLEFLNEFLNSGIIRLTQFLDEDTLRQVLPKEVYGTLRTQGFILKPHPRFRLFVTMNPDFYSGRNKLAQTLMNRMVQLWVPDYSPKEMEWILQSVHDFDPVRSIQLVETFYQGLKLEIKTGKIGRTYKDKYEVNLRTLLRIVGLYKKNLALYAETHRQKAPDAKTDMILLGRALWENLGFMMRTESDRQNLWLLLDNSLGLNQHQITRGDLEPHVRKIRFDPAKREVVFEEDLLPLRVPLKADSPFIPPENFDLPPTQQVLNELYWCSRRLLDGQHMLLVGETAAGKTTRMQFLHRLLHAALYYTNLSSESADEELAGGYQPDASGGGKFRFAPGLLEKAGREYNGRGASLLVDEFNLNSLIEYLNTAQDDRIMVTPGGVVPLGPDTIIIGAHNPPNYQGRNMVSPAVRGRYWESWVEEPDKNEATLRVGWLLKKIVEGGAKVLIIGAVLKELLWPHVANAASQHAANIKGVSVGGALLILVATAGVITGGVFFVRAARRYFRRLALLRHYASRVALSRAEHTAELSRVPKIARPQQDPVDPNSNSSLSQLPQEKEELVIDSDNEHFNRAFYAVAFSPDGRKLFAMRDYQGNHTLYIWSVQDWRLLERFSSEHWPGPARLPWPFRWIQDRYWPYGFDLDGNRIGIKRSGPPFHLFVDGRLVANWKGDRTQNSDGRIAEIRKGDIVILNSPAYQKELARAAAELSHPASIPQGSDHSNRRGGRFKIKWGVAVEWARRNKPS